MTYDKRTHESWSQMKTRCNNPFHHAADKYSEKGITYQASWERFENFFADMGKRPPRTSLDRIDNNGDYTKENCRWATPMEQSQNKSKPKNNTSGITGVHFKPRENAWEASGTCYGIRQYLYYGHSFERACEARKRWEQEKR